jgi:putative DNA-invertase from lambdoid prophage Rac
LETFTIEKRRTRKIGYCRVSTEDQTVDNQVLEMLKQGIAPADIYKDEGVSGTTAPKNRKGFRKVFDLILKGEVSELLIYEISRLGRNIHESLLLFLEIEQTGTRIISLSPNEEWTRTQKDSERVMLASMFAWFADMERKQLSERTKAGIARARAQGKQIGRAPNEKLNKESTRKDYERLKSQGFKPAQIARLLQIPTSTMYLYIDKWEDEERIKQNEAIGAGVAQ